MQTFPSLARRRVYGMLGYLVVLAIVALSLALYQKMFTPVVQVTLQADRSGLLLDLGSDVRLRGLPVGEVRDVRLDGHGDGVLIDLALEKDKAHSVPAFATAKLLPTTVFGTKFVSLEPPPGPATGPIQAGSVIQTTEVTIEINNIFLGLKEVLTTVEPAKINATLGAMSRALDGRGAELGEHLAQVNRYLSAFNPHLPNLRKDISASAKVVKTYADVMPEFLDIAKNASKTSVTLSDEAAALHALLIDFTRAAGDAEKFFGRIEAPLGTAMDMFDPVLRLLSEYSPEFTCLVQGLNENRKRVAVFGTYLSGAQAYVSFLPGQEGYKYPRDLQKFVQGDGPDCFGLPFISRDEVPPPRVRFDDGSQTVFRHPHDAATPEEVVAIYPELLFEQLFGAAPEEAFDNPLSEVLPR